MGGGIHGIFFGEHVFNLTSYPKNGTDLIQKERFAGLAVPIASLEGVDQGYLLMNQPLKSRAERMRQSSAMR